MIMRKKFFCTKKSEDGVALIFALAMLALLLIMLIGFLASAILEQRIAYSYRDDNGSRLLVRSALVRVKSLLTAKDDHPDDLLFMRNGAPEVTGKPDIVAPIVSLNSDTDASDTESDAYKTLKPLLRRYFGPNGSDGDTAEEWQWRNWLPKNVKMYHPQWIYYRAKPGDANSRITGRMAYVAIPNLGLNPVKLGPGTAERKGIKYDELAKTSLLTTGGVTKLNKFNNWLSVDVLMGKEGFYNATESASPYINFDNLDVENLHSGELGGIQGTSDQDWGKENAFATIFLNRTTKEFAHKYFEASTLNKAGKTPLQFTQHTDFANWQTFVNTNFAFDNANQANQAAANITDYVDADSTPTSDIAHNEWLDSDDHPTYTGNEKTPYINQIGMALQMKAVYSYTSQNIQDSENRTVVQTVEITPTGRFFAELINIYPEALTAGKVLLKNVEMQLNINCIQNGKTTTEKLSISQDEVTIPFDDSDTTIPKNGYRTAGVAMSANVIGATSLINTLTIAQNASIPELTITVEVTDLKFKKAVLQNGTTYEDYVAELAMDNMPRQVVGTVLITDTDGNQTVDASNSWSFSDKYLDNEGNEKDISAGEKATRNSVCYASFDVSDPRCNLQAANWASTMSSKAADIIDSSNLPNYGSKNSAAKDMKNDDLAKEQDLEPNDDPAKISTGYIRNGAMQSLRELGLIHRGKPWQTFNLHYIVPDQTLANVASEPAKLDYKHDPLFLERFRMNLTNDVLFNVNHPANFTGAFAPLTAGLAYRADNQGSTTPTLLSAAAQKELRAWLANKCYKITGTTPQEGDKFHRYIRHSELVPVIMDWAKNGTHSPFKDTVLADACIEDVICQIVPLVRFGEMFEYYTVFAVAQTIKDLGGTIYRTDTDGKLKEVKYGGNNPEVGKLEDCDLITSDTYLVARLRRTITCQADGGKYAKSCLWGHHKKTCEKKVEVLECYTLNLD